MKNRIYLALVAMLFTISANAQIFQSPYKRALKSAEQSNAKAIKNGWDIVLDPIEQVPTEVKKRTASMAAQTNWGKDLLLDATLRARLASECKYKVTVKVADTGHPDHPDLRQGQLPPSNYTTDANANDGHGHSTHVLGIIAADGSLGVLDALIDKGLVSHKAVKILSNTGSGSFSWVANCYATERADDKARIDRGEFVVYNGSFGGGTGLVQEVEAEIKKSADLGVVFLFAAGNTGGAGVNYPGNGKLSIACASLDQGLARSSYSTTGPEVWAGMPGRNINSTWKQGGYALLSGTSMATPFLTAATAIGFSKWGSRMGNTERVRAYLAWCCRDLPPTGKDNETGWGLALISNILDKDPGLTPGLPTDPPPPPPAPGLKGFDPLTLELSKEVVVNWTHYGGSAASETQAKTFKTAGPGSRKANQELSLNQVKVRFVIKFWHGDGTQSASDYLSSTLEKYFQNRGFLIPAGQDESWAAIYAGYFFDMHMAQTEKKEVNIEVVKFGSKGGEVQLVPPSAWTWPRK